MSQRQSRTMRMYRTQDWTFYNFTVRNQTESLKKGESVEKEQKPRKKKIDQQYRVSDIRMEFSLKTGLYELLSDVSETILSQFLTSKKEANRFKNALGFYLNICLKRNFTPSLNDFVLSYRKALNTPSAIRSYVPFLAAA